MKLSEAVGKIQTDSVRDMNEKQLRGIAAPLFNAALKRFRRLRSAGLLEHSPASRWLLDEGEDAFHLSKLKTRQDVQRSIRRAYSFLTAKTSTVKGARAFKKKIEKATGEMDNEQWKRFWNLYNRLSEAHPDFIIKYSSDQLQKIAREVVNDVWSDDLDRSFSAAETKMAEWEESQRGRVDEYDEWGGWF